MKDIKLFEAMAKLNLEQSERELVEKQANMLEQSFLKINNIDTENVLPLVTVLDLKNIMREDIAVKNLSREEILANAPEQYDGYFQVPKTLE